MTTRKIEFYIKSRLIIGRYGSILKFFQDDVLSYGSLPSSKNFIVFLHEILRTSANWAWHIIMTTMYIKFYMYYNLFYSLRFIRVNQRVYMLVLEKFLFCDKNFDEEYC
jgi:hypothetical protein